jgi:arginase family enzyme
METGIVCVPFHTDMGRWGMARGPQAILDAGLIARSHASGHTVGDEPGAHCGPHERRGAGLLARDGA